MTWYPIAFRRDLANDAPHAFRLQGRDLVLFFDAADAPSVLPDSCPHRLARLSDGQVREGFLECGYHGWLFDGQGQCRHVPQLRDDRNPSPSANLPCYTACEEQGIVWVWSKLDAVADPATIPTVVDLNDPDVHCVDFAIDLPYGQPFLIENVIDYAHIHVAHDGSRGGGHRDLAAPLSFQFHEESELGFRASYKSERGAEPQGRSTLVDAQVSFVGPNLVHYRSIFSDDSRKSGLALYCIPLGEGRSRLLYRAYSSFASRADRRRPRWLEHLSQCKLLEEDMAIVVGQARRMKASGRPWSQLWKPVDSSDGLVLRYRRWLDRFGDKADQAPSDHELGDNRFELHTRNCSDCRRVFNRCRTWRPWVEFAVILLLAVAIPSRSFIFSGLAVLAALLRQGLIYVEGQLSQGRDAQTVKKPG